LLRQGEVGQVIVALSCISDVQIKPPNSNYNSNLALNYMFSGVFRLFS
jgi:hypothetical protein